MIAAPGARFNRAHEPSVLQGRHGSRLASRGGPAVAACARGWGEVHPFADRLVAAHRTASEGTVGRALEDSRRGNSKDRHLCGARLHVAGEIGGPKREPDLRTRSRASSLEAARRPRDSSGDLVRLRQERRRAGDNSTCTESTRDRVALTVRGHSFGDAAELAAVPSGSASPTSPARAAERSGVSLVLGRCGPLSQRTTTGRRLPALHIQDRHRQLPARAGRKVNGIRTNLEGLRFG